jgi:SH3-like domain-containing protein
LIAYELGLRVLPMTTEAATVPAELDAGEVVTMTVDDSYAWRRVRREDGTTGWVSDRCLEEV